MGDARVSMDAVCDAFSVPAIVTPPEDAEPIQTVAFWITPMTEMQPRGGDFQRAEERRVLVLRRDEVPAVPRGTLITCAEMAGAPERLWRVDGIEQVEADHYRVVVVPGVE